MPTRTMPVKLEPARWGGLKAEHVPTLPAWFPLDPGPDDHGRQRPKLTDTQRAELRRIRQLTEAITGPFDGQRMAVSFDTDTGAPMMFAPMNTPHVWYRLDEHDSTQHVLVYRYDVSSPIHAASMRAVEDAFAQAGRDYAIAAREEDDHDRSAPTF